MSEGDKDIEIHLVGSIEEYNVEELVSAVTELQTLTISLQEESEQHRKAKDALEFELQTSTESFHKLETLLTAVTGKQEEVAKQLELSEEDVLGLGALLNDVKQDLEELLPDVTLNKLTEALQLVERHSDFIRRSASALYVPEVISTNRLLATMGGKIWQEHQDQQDELREAGERIELLTQQLDQAQADNDLLESLAKALEADLQRMKEDQQHARVDAQRREPEAKVGVENQQDGELLLKEGDSKDRHSSFSVKIVLPEVSMEYPPPEAQSPVPSGRSSKAASRRSKSRDFLRGSVEALEAAVSGFEQQIGRTTESEQQLRRRLADALEAERVWKQRFLEQQRQVQAVYPAAALSTGYNPLVTPTASYTGGGGSVILDGSIKESNRAGSVAQSSGIVPPRRPDGGIEIPHSPAQPMPLDAWHIGSPTGSPTGSYYAASSVASWPSTAGRGGALAGRSNGGGGRGRGSDVGRDAGNASTAPISPSRGEILSGASMVSHAGGPATYLAMPSPPASVVKAPLSSATGRPPRAALTPQSSSPLPVTPVAPLPLPQLATPISLSMLSQLTQRSDSIFSASRGPGLGGDAESLPSQAADLDASVDGGEMTARRCTNVGSATSTATAATTDFFGNRALVPARTDAETPVGISDSALLRMKAMSTVSSGGALCELLSLNGQNAFLQQQLGSIFATLEGGLRPGGTSASDGAGGVAGTAGAGAFPAPVVLQEQRERCVLLQEQMQAWLDAAHGELESLKEQQAVRWRALQLLSPSGTAYGRDINNFAGALASPTAAGGDPIPTSAPAGGGILRVNPQAHELLVNPVSMFSLGIQRSMAMPMHIPSPSATATAPPVDTTRVSANGGPAPEVVHAAPPPAVTSALLPQEEEKSLSSKSDAADGTQGPAFVNFELTAQVQQLQEKLTVSRFELLGLQDELAVLQDELRASTHASARHEESSRAKELALQRQVASLKVEIADLNDHISSLAAELSGCKSQAAAQASLVELQRAAQKHLDEGTSAIVSELEQRVKELEAVVQEKGDALMACERERDAKAAIVSVLEKQLLEEQQAAGETDENTKEEAREAIQELEQQLEALSAALCEKDEALRVLEEEAQSRLREREDELLQAELIIEDLERQANELREKLEERDAEAEQLLQEAHLEQQDLLQELGEKARDEAAAFEARLATLQLELREREVLLKQHQEMRAEQQEQARAVVASLEQHLTVLLRESNEKDAALLVQQESKRHLQERLAEEQVRVANLQARLDSELERRQTDERREWQRLEKGILEAQAEMLGGSKLLAAREKRVQELEAQVKDLERQREELREKAVKSNSAEPRAVGIPERIGQILDSFFEQHGEALAIGGLEPEATEPTMSSTVANAASCSSAQEEEGNHMDGDEHEHDDDCDSDGDSDGDDGEEDGEDVSGYGNINYYSAVSLPLGRETLRHRAVRGPLIGRSPEQPSASLSVVSREESASSLATSNAPTRFAAEVGASSAAFVGLPPIPSMPSVGSSRPYVPSARLALLERQHLQMVQQRRRVVGGAGRVSATGALSREASQLAAMNSGFGEQLWREASVASTTATAAAAAALAAPLHPRERAMLSELIEALALEASMSEMKVERLATRLRELRWKRVTEHRRLLKSWHLWIQRWVEMSDKAEIQQHSQQNGKVSEELDDDRLDDSTSSDHPLTREGSSDSAPSDVGPSTRMPSSRASDAVVSARVSSGSICDVAAPLDEDPSVSDEMDDGDADASAAMRDSSGAPEEGDTATDPNVFVYHAFAEAADEGDEDDHENHNAHVHAAGSTVAQHVHLYHHQLMELKQERKRLALEQKLQRHAADSYQVVEVTDAGLVPHLQDVYDSADDDDDKKGDGEVGEDRESHGHLVQIGSSSFGSNGGGSGGLDLPLHRNGEEEVEEEEAREEEGRIETPDEEEVDADQMDVSHRARKVSGFPSLSLRIREDGDGEGMTTESPSLLGEGESVDEALTDDGESQVVVEASYLEGRQFPAGEADWIRDIEEENYDYLRVVVANGVNGVKIRRTGANGAGYYHGDGGSYSTVPSPYVAHVTPGEFPLSRATGGSQQLGAGAETPPFSAVEGDAAGDEAVEEAREEEAEEEEEAVWGRPRKLGGVAFGKRERDALDAHLCSLHARNLELLEELQQAKEKAATNEEQMGALVTQLVTLGAEVQGLEAALCMWEQRLGDLRAAGGVDQAAADY